MTNNSPIDTVPAELIHPIRLDRIARTASFVAGIFTADELVAAARLHLGADVVECLGRDRHLVNFRVA